MAKELTPGGWEILHGRGWVTHLDVDPALVNASEGQRAFHYDGKDGSYTGDWTLVFHFIPALRVRTKQSRWITCQPGTWLLYPPDSIYWQDTRKATLPLHAVWLRFHGGEKLGLTRLINNPHHCARFHDPNGWLLKKIRDLALFSDSHKEKEYPHVLMGLMEILYQLLQSTPIGTGHYALPTTETIAPHASLVMKVRDYLTHHLHESIRLPKLAKALHTSVSTLKRHHMAATGDTISRTLIRMRISQTKSLLAQGHSVAEAAEQTGFYDQFHLSKTFRRVEGITPREFMRNLSHSPQTENGRRGSRPSKPDSRRNTTTRTASSTRLP